MNLQWSWRVDIMGERFDIGRERILVGIFVACQNVKIGSDIAGVLVCRLARQRHNSDVIPDLIAALS